ncbi:metallophosphoesterase family protein [Cnuibacter sp. UC19_7]|uniref:metallophosphoesterase family protein n=1 Tax=Cnuibacter sp. UC19_7 TaxID=3350166 RepID=UPI00366EA549
MSVRVVVLSDTHLPARAKVLPEVLLEAIDTADVVMHAGDWVDVATLDLLTSASRELVGVWGNNDPEPLRERLPEVARTTVEGVRFAMVHETGAATGRERRMDARYADDADVLVFGHSHIPWDTVTARGLRLLNPGSPTDRRRQPVGTFLTLDVEAGALADLRLVPVPSVAGRKADVSDA